jgi:hypothetical protein
MNRGDGCAVPVVLGPETNTPSGEWNPRVSRDESRLIFAASDRQLVCYTAENNSARGAKR